MCYDHVAICHIRFVTLINRSLNHAIVKVVHLCVGKCVNMHSICDSKHEDVFICLYGLFDGYVCHATENIH